MRAHAPVFWMKTWKIQAEFFKLKCQFQNGVRLVAAVTVENEQTRDGNGYLKVSGRNRTFEKYPDGKGYLKSIGTEKDIWSEPGPRMRIRDSVPLSQKNILRGPLTFLERIGTVLWAKINVSNTHKTGFWSLFGGFFQNFRRPVSFITEYTRG